MADYILLVHHTLAREVKFLLMKEIAGYAYSPTCGGNIEYTGMAELRRKDRIYRKSLLRINFKVIEEIKLLKRWI